MEAIKKEVKKTQMDFIEAHSIRELLQKVNIHNTECPDSLILKEDIVEMIREEGTFILLYYKRRQ